VTYEDPHPSKSGHTQTPEQIAEEIAGHEQAIHSLDPQLSGDPAVDATVERITGVPAPGPVEGVRTQAALTNDDQVRIAPGQEEQAAQAGYWIPNEGFVPAGSPRAKQLRDLAIYGGPPAGDHTDRDPEIDLDLVDAEDFDTTGLRHGPTADQVVALRAGTALDPIWHTTKPTMGEIRDADQVPLPFEVDAGEFIRAGAHLFNAIYWLPQPELQEFFRSMPESVKRAYARAQGAFLPDDVRPQPDDEDVYADDQTTNPT